MEYQTYINDADLVRKYEFTPFGFLHTNPLYTTKAVDPQKKESLRLFAEYCQTLKQQAAFKGAVESLSAGGTATFDGIVLEKVKFLNQTTNNMIQATSLMLNTQGVEIQNQAMDSNIQVEPLKNAFVETLGALDQISQYKQKALPQMKATIEEFKELAQAGEAAIKRIEDGKGIA